MANCVACKSCPARKTSKAGALGGASLATFVGQINACFILPCHKAAGYNQTPEQVLAGEVRGCVGVAMVRDAMSRHWPDGIETLSGDAMAFESLHEFIAHHLQITLAEAVEEWPEDRIQAASMDEIEKVLRGEAYCDQR